MISKKLFNYCYDNFERIREFDYPQCTDVALHFNCGVADVYDAINTIWYTKFNMKYYK